MLKLLAAVMALALPALPFAAQAQAQAQAQTPDPAPIEVMVVGTFHMGNPGRDLHNAQVDPVTTPGKQAELEAVAEALSRFRPTAVAVERVAGDPSTLLDPRYPAFTPADLLADPDERIQVGYRLAHRLGLERVYAIDEQDRDGQPPYFPFEAVQTWAEIHGQAETLGRMHAEVGALMTDLELRQRTDSVGRLLASMNTPERAASDQALYMRMLALGGGDDQPGAVLNGRWYTRNAVIFARLMQVARPGDRIVIVYGSGHAFWLRHFVQTTPGFKLVEAGDYLPVS